MCMPAARCALKASSFLSLFPCSSSEQCLLRCQISTPQQCQGEQDSALRQCQGEQDSKLQQCQGEQDSRLRPCQSVTVRACLCVTGACHGCETLCAGRCITSSGLSRGMVACSCSINCTQCSQVACWGLTKSQEMTIVRGMARQCNVQGLSDSEVRGTERAGQSKRRLLQGVTDCVRAPEGLILHTVKQGD
eukprot:1160093-Pelagomonas_calceolata.AAC.9